MDSSDFVPFDQYDFEKCREFQEFLLHILEYTTSSQPSHPDQNNHEHELSLVDQAKRFFHAKKYPPNSSSDNHNDQVTYLDKSEKKNSCFEFIETISQLLMDKSSAAEGQDAFLKLLSLMPGYVEPRTNDIPDGTACVPVDIKPRLNVADFKRKPWL